MTDRGLHRANNVHIGSEHICEGDLLVTYDTGRFDNCPICGQCTVSEDSKILESLPQNDAKNYTEMYQHFLGSAVYAVARDPRNIAAMRLLDMQKSLAEKYGLDIDDLQITYKIIEKTLEAEDFPGKREVKTFYNVDVRKRHAK